MLIRLVLSLAFVGVVLWFAARVAKKRGLGGANQGLIEVVARQRIGRSSSVNVLRIGDVVLVVGATEEQITLLAEVDNETIDPTSPPAAPPRLPARAPAPVHEPRYAADDYDGGYDAPAYDAPVHEAQRYEGHGYDGHAEAPAYDGGGYADEAHHAPGYGAGYDDRRGSDVRRAGGHHAEGPRHSGAVRRPAVAPQTAGGPLAGSVFDKNGWGTFVNELRERTVRRP